MSNSGLQKFFMQTVAARMSRVEKWFGRARKNCSVDAAHALSTSLRRILVADRVAHDLFGRRILKKKMRTPLADLRTALGNLRDCQELFLKAEAFNGEDIFACAFRRRLRQGLGESEKGFAGPLADFDIHQLCACASPERLSKRLKPVSDRALPDFLECLLRDVSDNVSVAVNTQLDADLHLVRVRYKYFRYAVEMFAPDFVCADADRLKYLRMIQTELGEAHDWSVMLQRLNGFVCVCPAGDSAPLLSFVREKSRSAHVQARVCIARELVNLQKLLSFKGE